VTEVGSPDSQTAEYPAFQDAGTLPAWLTAAPRVRAPRHSDPPQYRFRFAPRWASRPPPYASLRPPDVIRLSVCRAAIVIHFNVRLTSIVIHKNK
jgi:hypothetical protein